MVTVGRYIITCALRSSLTFGLSSWFDLSVAVIGRHIIPKTSRVALSL